MRKKRPEQVLQVAVAKYLALALRPPTWWTSIDHGVGKLGPAEAGLRKARGVQAGIADMLVLHPAGMPNMAVTRVIWIELKAGRGKTSEAQKDFHDRVMACGCLLLIARSIEEVDWFLRREGVPLYARLG